MADKLREFEYDVIHPYSEKDSKEEPITQMSNSYARPIARPMSIFNWVDARMMKGVKPYCTNRGCVVKAYRRPRKRKSWTNPGKYENKKEVTWALKFFEENERQIYLYNILKLWVSSKL